ncbi:MAG: hypothetical protein V7L25_20320 [Nostoc sp.]|uniref:hypothetical protein n=1 Tax=Nostoc sp. TaxID=1180 RepID=UPI002FF23A92
MSKLAKDYLKQFDNENIVVSNEIIISLIDKAQELNADKLNKSDFKEIADALSTGIQQSKFENEKLFSDTSDKKRNLSDYQKVRDSLLELESFQNKLFIAYTNSKIDSILTDEKSGAKAKIIQATEKLKEANAGLKNFDNFLNFLGNLTNLISAILVAIQTPSVASISIILQRLNALT